MSIHLNAELPYNDKKANFSSRLFGIVMETVVKSWPIIHYLLACNLSPAHINNAQRLDLNGASHVDCTSQLPDLIHFSHHFHFPSSYYFINFCVSRSFNPAVALFCFLFICFMWSIYREMHLSHKAMDSRYKAQGTWGSKKALVTSTRH